MVKRLLHILLMGAALLAGFATTTLAQPSSDPQPLSAFVDRNEITLNEVLTLTIRVDNSLGNSRPSLTALNRDFETIGNISTRSSYSNINGTVQSFVDYIVRLRPRSTGTLTIPAFRIGSEVTSSIRVSVGEADQVSSAGDSEIFIESTVSKEQVYVQEQLLYTIKLYYSISFDQGAQLTSPQVADSVVQQLGSDETYSEIIDGIRYNVTERRFVVFPQGSGQLTIPPVYFTATVGRRGGLTRFFNNRTSVREINLASDTHNIDVLGKPADFPEGTWLPATDVSIEESWSGPVDSLTVGESVTRNIRISATGLSSSLLPGITYEDMNGLKFYPDQPVSEDSATETGVSGIRSEGTAIVPSQPGEFVIPEIVIPWWNTVTNTLENAVIPARTISVVAGSNQVTSTPGSFAIPGNPATDAIPVPNIQGSASMPASQTSGLYLFWITATAVFAAAWLFSTAMWLRSRRMLAYSITTTPSINGQRQQSARPPVSPNAETALKLLNTAISNGSPPEIRHRLIQWGQALFPDSNIMTLTHLSQRCKDTSLDGQLQAIEQALYSEQKETAFTPVDLAGIVSRLHKGHKNRRSSAKDHTLPPLYKN